MTRVTYIVIPRGKNTVPYEVTNLREAVEATQNRTTGDFKAKYTKIDERFLKE